MKEQVGWRIVALGIAFLTLFGGIVGVWMDTQRDIAALQVEVTRNKEMVIGIKTDVDVKFDKIDSKLDKLNDKIDKLH